MAAHASVVTGGCYQLPPHAVMVPVGAMQTTQNGQVPPAQDSSAAGSPLLPIAAGVGIGGALVLSAFGIDRMCRSIKAAKAPDLCYRDTAEAMVDDQVAYSKAALKTTLSRLCEQKFRSEGSRKYNGARMLFSSEPELRAAVDRSVQKSLANGLTPRKMLRLLNDQVHVLQTKRLQSGLTAQAAYTKTYLRPFRIGRTLDHDIAAMDAAELFDCEDVSRFALAYFKTLAGSRGKSSQDSVHYIMLAHDAGGWRVIDKQNPNRRSAVLHQGASSRADAKTALAAFARKRYGTTQHTNLTVFTQTAR